MKQICLVNLFPLSISKRGDIWCTGPFTCGFRSDDTLYAYSAPPPAGIVRREARVAVDRAVGGALIDFALDESRTAIPVVVACARAQIRCRRRPCGARNFLPSPRPPSSSTDSVATRRRWFPPAHRWRTDGAAHAYSTATTPTVTAPRQQHRRRRWWHWQHHREPVAAAKGATALWTWTRPWTSERTRLGRPGWVSE